MRARNILRKIGRGLGVFLLLPILEALLIAGPTATLAYSSFDSGFEDWYRAHPYVSIVSGFWLIPGAVLTKVIRKKLTPRFERHSGMDNAKGVVALFEAIDNVVGVKSVRFATCLDAIRKGSSSPECGVVFREITQPLKQIEELVHAVYYFFNLQKPEGEDMQFRVALAKMGRKHMSEFICFNPQDRPPHGKLSDYQCHECGFSRAKETRDLVIVPNIAKNLKKKASKKRNYVAVGGGAGNGSLLVYPVFCYASSDIVYCLSIYCTQPGYFDYEEEKLFRHIFDKIEKRIALEHALLELREHTCD